MLIPMVLILANDGQEGWHWMTLTLIILIIPNNF